MPTPPDCDTTPTLPRTGATGEKGRVHAKRRVGVDDADAVGPDETDATPGTAR